MGQNDIDAIAERVARLEREVGRWKRSATAKLVLLAAMVVLSGVRGIDKARAAGGEQTSLQV